MIDLFDGYEVKVTFFLDHPAMRAGKGVEVEVVKIMMSYLSS